MKHVILLITLLFILIPGGHAQKSNKPSRSFTYSLCEAEFGFCKQKCTVKLIKGDKIAIGSYIKVYFQGELLTEGYILKHMSGNIYILKDKKDVSNPEICGGCCGSAYDINISKKQIWGC